jgi:hypothetical protein
VGFLGGRPGIRGRPVPGLHLGYLLHDTLPPFISLRRELYEDIPELYEDAQKYRDMIETIRWNSTSLLKLITNRIRHSLPALAHHDDKACWNALFSGAPGGGSFQYMIDRTLYRPREIIQFCTLALECARDSQTTVPLQPIWTAQDPRLTGLGAPSGRLAIPITYHRTDHQRGDWPAAGSSRH